MSSLRTGRRMHGLRQRGSRSGKHPDPTCNIVFISDKINTRVVSNIIEQEVYSRNGKRYIRLTIDIIVFIVHQVVAPYGVSPSA